MKNPLALIIFLLALSGLTALADEPLLMINTQMHNLAVMELSVDASESLMLSCSFDKTARLWDLETGELIRVLRIPIDSGEEGMIYSCALSPDGRYAALGGVTVDDDLYIYDTSSGKMRQCLKELPASVSKLLFSPDGRYLAVGLIGQYGVYIYRTSDWQVKAKLDGYMTNVSGLSFDVAGNLVTFSFDSKLRLYNPEFSLLRERAFAEEHSTIRGTFKPDGNEIALIKWMDGKAELLVLNTEDLTTLYQHVWTDKPVEKSVYEVVRYSKDSKQLYVVGGHQDVPDQEWQHLVRVWQDYRKGHYQDYPVDIMSIWDLEPMQDGGFVYSNYYPDMFRISAEGDTLFQIRSETKKFNSCHPKHLTVNQIGDEIGFMSSGIDNYCFRVSTRSLTTEESTECSYTDSIPGFQVTNWDGSNSPLLNGRQISTLSDKYWFWCVDIASDPVNIVLGGSYHLNCLDAEENVMWETDLPAAIFAVNISGDAKTVATAQSDGTLRWYRMSDGALVLSLFVHQDGKRWILWTPSGYYDCSPGAETLIGWHVNQDPDKEALFYPVDRFRSTYYRPDVIDLILTTLDETEAVRQANEAVGITTTAKGVGTILPPSIKIISPAHNAGFDTQEVTIQYELDTLDFEPVTAIKVLLDGRPLKIVRFDPPDSIEIFQASLKNVTKSVACTVKLEIPVSVPSRNCRIGLIAVNKFGNSELAEVKLVWDGKASQTAIEQKPNLYVLAIGVSDYDADQLRLQFSAKDADDFASTIRLQEDLMYESVKLRLLTDKTATRDNVLDALDWLQQECQTGDVAMIFLSGHGANDKIGLFYYLPVGADVTRLKATCIPFSDFENTLSAIPGKVILFADACHSGGIYTDSQLQMPDLNRFINELSSPEVGVVIFTSSTPRQRSLESAEWQNGAFTKALIEGLTGGADFKNKGTISVKGLDFYVSDRVKELTGGKQTPTTIVPRSIPDFDLVKLSGSNEK